MAIQPIETRYAGCRFRSRLEARWAVAFDHLGVRWEYEPQGYQVGARRRPYLPDFYLTDLGWWVEVKGAAERLDMTLMLDAVHPTLGLGRTDPFLMTNLLILGDLPRPGALHAHWSLSRSASIGVPLTGVVAPGAGCGGTCLFTSPRFGLHYFAPIPAWRQVLADGVEVDRATHSQVSRLGALIVPACRATPKPPAGLDPTQAIPLPHADAAPQWVRALEAARSARFEYGEAA